MKYSLIKGDYYIVGHSPDGDSLKFKANNPARWQSIEQSNPDTFQQHLKKEEGVLMLRLEGVDALETHYSPPPLPLPPDLKNRKVDQLEKPQAGHHHQPPEFATKATQALLALFGIRRLEWRRWGTNQWVDKIYLQKWGREVCLTEKYSDPFPGYIISRESEQNGRPVAWVFVGDTSVRDGSILEVAEVAEMIDQSANYHLLQQGLVYPYFFMTLPGLLRDKLAQASQAAYKAARRGAANLWQVDDSLVGFRVGGVHLLHESQVLYPYLFRRVIRHWYHTNLQQYWQAVRKNRSFQPSDRIDLDGFFNAGNPYIFIISSQDFVRLEEVVYINGTKLKLTRPPFDVVFLA